MVTNGKSHNDIEKTAQEEIPHKLKAIHEKVQEMLEKAYEKSKRNYNLRARQIEYQPGEIIWKKNTILSNKQKNVAQKLLPRYEKCTIVQKVGGNSYKLRNSQGKDIGIFPTHMLKQ